VTRFSVRPATPDDAAQIIEVERACFHDAWSAAGIHKILGDEKSLVYVAEEGKQIVGYAAAWTISDEGEITRVAVLEAQRGRGLGRALLQHTQNECVRRGATLIFLEVRESNVAARTLYARCGWIEVGRRKRYYQDGEDALVLRLASHPER
jgi:ribosomal-protein-alanine N-acetyltransferase